MSYTLLFFLNLFASENLILFSQYVILTFLNVLKNVIIFKRFIVSSCKKFTYLNNFIIIYRTGSKKQTF